MKTRVEKLRAVLAEDRLDGMLITGSTNRRYMSGFTGSAGSLFVSEDEALLLTDFRYVDQAAAQAPAFDVVRCDDLFGKLGELLANRSDARIGFEADKVTVAQMDNLQKAVADSGTGAAEWIATRD